MGVMVLLMVIKGMAKLRVHLQLIAVILVCISLYMFSTDGEGERRGGWDLN